MNQIYSAIDALLNVLHANKMDYVLNVKQIELTLLSVIAQPPVYLGLISVLQSVLVNIIIYK